MYWGHPQQTRCGPSLAHGVCLVSARHPGDSFPINLPLEAVLKLTSDNLFPSLSWSAPFAVHKNRGPASDTIFLMCTSVLSICNDDKCERLEYMCKTDREDPQVGSFLISLSLYFDLFWFLFLTYVLQFIIEICILFNCHLILKSDIWHL